ncbi:MAG: hypothetical protein OQJ81_07255 [Melioribacteraceae bacterium]|nr:hypothetical protein [Melioribacteraceae bacterium]
MRIILFILLFVCTSIQFAQGGISKISELQKIYFISETNSLTANLVNPAALSINDNDDGFLLSYDFLETQSQGNTIASLSLGSLGFSYQDIYSYNGLKLTNYGINISVGGDFFSFGTSNKIVTVKYAEREKSHFIIDAGAILQPLPILSIGFLASNISDVKLDSLQYQQIYSVGARISFVKNIFDVFVQTDFKDSDELNTNVQASAGFSIKPVNFLEFRTWVMGTKELINEGIVTAIFKIENGLILSASTHFNSDQEKTRYNLMVALPLQSINF